MTPGKGRDHRLRAIADGERRLVANLVIVPSGLGVCAKVGKFGNVRAGREMAAGASQDQAPNGVVRRARARKTPCKACHMLKESALRFSGRAICTMPMPAELRLQRIRGSSDLKAVELIRALSSSNNAASSAIIGRPASSVIEDDRRKALSPLGERFGDGLVPRIGASGPETLARLARPSEPGAFAVARAGANPPQFSGGTLDPSASRMKSAAFAISDARARHSSDCLENRMLGKRRAA